MIRFIQRHIVLNLSFLPYRILWLFGLGSLLAWGLTSVYQDFRGQALATLDRNADVLQEAARDRPDDPELQRQLGWLYLFDPVLLDAERAMRHIQRAVELSPFDWSLWIDVGRAYEQRGQQPQAGQAYQKAIALAPTYFRPRWVYANFLLRSDRAEPGTNEFAHLAEANPDAAAQIFDLVWQASGGNSQVLVAFGQRLSSDITRSKLVAFLAQRGKYEEALAAWKGMGPDPELKVASGLAIISKLMGAQQWEQAQHLWPQVVQVRYGNLSSDEAIFWNRGFERDPLRTGFDWILESSPEVDVSIDTTVNQAGARSLLLRFRQHENVRFGGVSHYLLVNPSTPYRLQFQYKTEDMLARNGLAVEVTDAERPERLRVQSPSLRNPTEWTAEALTFQTSADTRVIRLRILRQPTNVLHDYIAGKVWFDEFALEPAKSTAISAP
jgi:tetratricopeptide (TPR) repeat protein